MAIRTITKDGDPILRKVCRPVTDFSDRLFTVLDDMAETMHKADGVGLAGPQVSFLRRVAVVDVGDEHGLIELINPEVVDVSKETQYVQEGCLSVPERYGMTTRPMWAKVRAQDRHGEFFEIEGEGLLAQALCHEIDHLDGKLFTDIVEEWLKPEDMAEGKKKR